MPKKLFERENGELFNPKKSLENFKWKGWIRIFAQEPFLLITFVVILFFTKNLFSFGEN